MRLWDWALQAYARRGVEPLCLELQDRHGQSVPYLLWAAWLDAEGCHPSPDDLHTAAELSRNWEAGVTGLLRSARRALKTPPSSVNAAGAAVLRGQVKDAELQAERLLLESLETISRSGRPPDRSPSVLREACAAWAPRAPAALVARLEALLAPSLVEHAGDLV